jgi:acetyl-CoA acetyltransferase family protein
MRDAVVVDGVRTPFGRAGRRGMFRAISHVDLMVPLLKEIIRRNSLDAREIDEVHMGSVHLATRSTKARTYMFEAGLPDSIWGTDVNTQCASSLQTTVEACQCVACGGADIILAGGIETMDRQGVVPPEEAAGKPVPPRVFAGPVPEITDTPYPPDWKDAQLLPWWFELKDRRLMNMLWTAENLHAQFGITRREADEWALRSQLAAVAAQDAGNFESEIMPVTINYKDGSSETISKDQGPRRETNIEALSQLKPIMKEDGFVTAGNSCPRNDGGTITLITTKEIAKERGWKPLLTYRHSATIGVDPNVMGVGPRWATAKLLKRSGMKLEDFDVIEINEAFACVVNYWIRELKASDKVVERINRWGGAIALGHPLGASGSRLVMTAGFQARQNGGRWALTTLCQGSGMGYAAAWEREDY